MTTCTSLMAAHQAIIVSVEVDDYYNVSTIRIDRKLNFTHLGVVEEIAGGAAGASIDMRAEVAVLTRNVVFQGDEDSERYMFGAQIMVNTPSTRPRANIRFEQAEFRQTGQAFRLGRYSIHFHMHGDLAYQSWVKGCAIHHTYNRAVTIHGSHRVILRDNVAYQCMGHTFFLEVGVRAVRQLHVRWGLPAGRWLGARWLSSRGAHVTACVRMEGRLRCRSYNVSTYVRCHPLLNVLTPRSPAGRH